MQIQALGFGPRDGVFDDVQEKKRVCEGVVTDQEVTSLVEVDQEAQNLIVLVRECAEAYNAAMQVCTNVENKTPDVADNSRYITNKKSLIYTYGYLAQLLQMLYLPVANTSSDLFSQKDTIVGAIEWLKGFEKQVCVILQEHYQIL